MSSEEDKHDTFEAPKVSEEFSLGNVHTGLEKIRTRLLDLTARNKLLNFRHPKTSCLRFVDTALDTVFQYLMEGNPFTVEAVPEPDGLVRSSGGAHPLIDDAQEEDKIPAKDYAAEHGWSTTLIWIRVTNHRDCAYWHTKTIWTGPQRRLRLQPGPQSRNLVRICFICASDFWNGRIRRSLKVPMHPF